MEIDDVVGANEWEDGRDHLLLPGDEIYLPADAQRPAAEPDDTAESGDADGEAAQGAPADASEVCDGGALSDDYAVTDSDTLEAVAARLGLQVSELEETNRFGVAGMPTFDDVDSIVVPCTRNWPANVTFYELIDPATCPDEGFALQGQYELQAAEGAEELAARFGITVDRLVAPNPIPDFTTLRAGDTINVCANWFE